MVRTKCTKVDISFFSLYSEKMAKLTKCPIRRSRRLHGKTWVSLMYGIYLKYVQEKRDLIIWPMGAQEKHRKAEWKAKDDVVFKSIAMNQVKHIVSWNKLIKKGIIKDNLFIV
jgi:hypothetical protein